MAESEPIENHELDGDDPAHGDGKDLQPLRFELKVVSREKCREIRKPEHHRVNGEEDHGPVAEFAKAEPATGKG